MLSNQTYHAVVYEWQPNQPKLQHVPLHNLNLGYQLLLADTVTLLLLACFLPLCIYVFMSSLCLSLFSFIPTFAYALLFLYFLKCTM